jgi:2-hydroxychromene-2-carboxylate isomerase
LKAAPIEFYFDFVSPYGYLAATQIEELARRHDRTVEWHPFLIGVTVMQVMGLKPLMETPLKSEYLRIDRPRMAKILGVPLTIPDMAGVNSLAACRAFYWQNERDSKIARDLAMRLLQRLWVDGRDITTADAVAEEAETLGIDGGEVKTAVEDPRVKDLLRQAVDQAIAKNIFGSPFFIVDDQPIFGVDRLWMVEHWLKYHSWDPPGS